MTDWITVSITTAKGSTPRDSGTWMQVFTDHLTGTIGGGALEWQAIQHARKMLTDRISHDHLRLALGPNLGQCCGGLVELTFAHNQPPPSPRKSPLWIWGAGHVGRALAGVLAPLEQHDITLIDVAQDRFPQILPNHVTPVTGAEPALLISHAPTDAAHIIATYSHELDLTLCDRLLHHGFASAGLIGSHTKWTRFTKRLSALGHGSAQINAIQCPIGDTSLGKHPQAIALGVAAQLVSNQTHAKAEGSHACAHP